MDYGDSYWGLYRDYCKGSIPPFPTKHQGDEGCSEPLPRGQAGEVSPSQSAYAKSTSEASTKLLYSST